MTPEPEISIEPDVAPEPTQSPEATPQIDQGQQSPEPEIVETPINSNENNETTTL